MNWIAVGALLLAAAVLVGAFGAHALRDRLDAYATGIYERAVFYHTVHAAGVLAIGIAIGARVVAVPLASLAAWLVLAGIVIFSGSLYALALTGMRRLGAVTPLGGLALVAGWIALAVAAVRG